MSGELVPAETARLLRALRQLREDHANAVECGDDMTEVPTAMLGAVLGELARLIEAAAAEPDRCACHRSPFDHEYECPRAVVIYGGIDYRIGAQYLDRDGMRWSLWDENSAGEPGPLGEIVEESGPLTAVEPIRDGGPF